MGRARCREIRIRNVVARGQKRMECLVNSYSLVLAGVMVGDGGDAGDGVEI